jgi:hypothetical protein
MVEKALEFRTKPIPAEPVEFLIGTEDGTQEETFVAVPQISGYDLLQYSILLTKGGTDTNSLIDGFFRDVMEPAEHERFVKFIRNPDVFVDAKQLADIFLALFVRYSAGANEQDRPTQPPVPSSSGPGGTEDSSKDDASNSESTPPA